MSHTELLLTSCRDADIYPRNIVHDAIPRYHRQGYFDRLNEHEERLFCSADEKSSLDIWEYDDYIKEFQNTCATNIFELKGRLEGQSLFFHDDPRCRFLFIHAPNSRERLRISRKMLTCALTHHQVMPNFVDFIFPFGYQEYKEDYHFSGFREDTRLLSTDGGLRIPELGRSGREIRMCYSLKSVEESEINPKWSIRQTSLYHSFDVETGKAVWIVIKGSPLIKQRIQAATAPSSEEPSNLKSFESTPKSFASTLATHLVLCDWCDEDWRWYLNYLEKRLQTLTRHSLAVAVSKAPSIKEAPTFSPVEKSSTFSLTRSLSNLTKRNLTASTRLTNSSLTPKREKFVPSFQPPSPILTRSPHSQAARTGPPLPPVLPPGMPGSTLQRSRTEDEDFSFERLQKVQEIEDCANEVLLVLEANINVLTQLQEHYKAVTQSDDCPIDIKTDCKKEMAHFKKRVRSIVTDLEMQRSSAQTLLRLSENRKSFLYGILNYHNIEASKLLAKKSNHSAKRMEDMTEAMHEVAVKTKQETVSMRIITLVTLFFLPGTFISTIMSTDIIKFNDNSGKDGKIFQLGALQLYLAITLPMMALTFGAWALVYYWTNKRQQEKAQKEGKLWA